MNRTQNPPVRAEPVEASASAPLVFTDILILLKDGLRMFEHSLRQAQDSRKYRLSPFDRLRMHGHFDRLSANGVFYVF